MTDKTAEQTAIRRALLANGYTPLANVSKKCMLKNWPRLVVDEAMIEDWSDRGGLKATGVRIEGALVALDFDIDDTAALDAIWDALPDDLFALLDKMPMRRGSGEKVCLFCRAAGGAVVENIWSKAYYRPGEEGLDGAKTHRLEIFGAGGGGRQIGVYGAHTVENGEVLVSYSWVGGRGLVEVPLGELPEVSVAQLENLADVVSSVLHDLGWAYEVRALDGKVSGGREYVLGEDDVFEVHGGARVDLAGLEDMARNWDGVRVSMSWREGVSARNTTRGLVSINPGDDRVQIWDSMTGVLYRPAGGDVRGTVERLSEKLRGRDRVGVSKGSPDSESESGSGDLFARLLAASDPEKRIFSQSGVDEGGAGEVAGGDGRETVNLTSGQLTVATLQVAVRLAEMEYLFDMSGRLVGVFDGVIREMTEPRLSLEIGAAFRCVRVERRGKNDVVVDVDPSGGLVKQVLAYMPEAGFRRLRGVVDMPVIARGGRIVADGYDGESQLLVSDSSGAAAWLQDGVSHDTVSAALETLWRPFSEFPFVGAGDRGGALACLLTAVCRSWLPTAPLFAFDAPVQGSGKSLLCRAVGALSGRCLFSSPLPLKNEDEIRKRLMSMLMGGPSAVIYDNQIGLLDSASLAAVLTSETFSDRELGHNTRTLQAPTSVLVMVNGNNLALGGDMPRRTVRVRIDPQMDTPFERQFDFDPETWVRENRGQMVAAALTLLRWGMAGAGKGRVGSFERWDEVVGQTVARIGREIDGQFGDPADVIKAAHEDDPRRDELGDLLLALRDEFGNKWFTASEVTSRMAGAGAANPLVEAFGYDKTPSSRSVGRHLIFRRDAWVNGLCIQVGVDTKANTKRFRVWAEDDAADVVVQGALEERRAVQKSRLGAISKPGG